MGKNLNRYQKSIIVLSIISIASMIVAAITYGIFLHTNWLFPYILIVSSFIIIVNSLNLHSALSKRNLKLEESIPLMKHRMNKSLTSSILFFSVGVPIFIDAYYKGLLQNVLELLISLALISIGMIIYFVTYAPRDKHIEEELIKRNKRNKK